MSFLDKIAQLFENELAWGIATGVLFVLAIGFIVYSALCAASDADDFSEEDLKEALSDDRSSEV